MSEILQWFAFFLSPFLYFLFFLLPFFFFFLSNHKLFTACFDTQKYYEAAVRDTVWVEPG